MDQKDFMRQATAWIGEAVGRLYPESVDARRVTKAAVDAFAAGWDEAAKLGKVEYDLPPSMAKHRNAGFEAYHSGRYSFTAFGLEAALRNYVKSEYKYPVGVAGEADDG